MSTEFNKLESRVAEQELLLALSMRELDYFYEYANNVLELISKENADPKLRDLVLREMHAMKEKITKIQVQLNDTHSLKERKQRTVGNFTSGS